MQLDELDQKIEKLKRNILWELVKQEFESSCREYISKREWKSVEDLDKWLGEALMQYIDLRDSIEKYYNDKIYS